MYACCLDTRWAEKMFRRKSSKFRNIRITRLLIFDHPKWLSRGRRAPQDGSQLIFRCASDKHVGRTAIKTFANDLKLHVYYSIRVSMSSVWLIREIFGWGHWTWRWGN